jgi:hypothetical protein
LALNLDEACVTLPKEQCLELVPHLRVSPVLGKNISWIIRSGNVIKAQHLGSNGLANPVKGKHGVMLM